ncbi:hypothetical protein ACH4KC_02170 [Streptomyces griseoaurantiacus]|uniref:hypothetical protein n=1 Tax=Streptomyces TaxID=1883 RepID=UPI003246805B
MQSPSVPTSDASTIQTPDALPTPTSDASTIPAPDAFRAPEPDVSVILPCAGYATRFGAPYAKELHCLAPGVTVLDRSLEAAVELAKSGLTVRLVVVFRAHKLDTVGYLARYAETFQMVFVYQDESLDAGLDGAIRSALPLTRGPVALVLPDIVVDGVNSVGSLLAALRRTRAPGNSGWSVVAARERDPDTLRQMGALTLREPDAPPEGEGEGGDEVLTVGAAAEKPSDPAGFNGLWGMVAVAEEEAHRLPDVVRKGADSPLAGAAAVVVKEIVNYNTVAG